MKQFITTLSSILLLTCGLTAQITIVADDIPSVGITAEQTTDTLPDQTIQAGGTGMLSWDFTALQDHEPGSFNFLSPDDTPYAGLFPAANLASQLDTIGFIYMHKDADRLSVLGTYGAVEFQGLELEVKIDLEPAQSLIRFPATFGDMYEETIDQTVQVSGTDIGVPFDSIRNVTTTERSVNIDAYGEMTTPVGSYESIRSSETEISVNRIYVLNSGIWNLFDESEPDTIVNYNWWTNQNGLAFPLVQLGIDVSTGAREVTWLKSFVSGTTSSFSLQVHVFPNPASDLIHIELPEYMEGHVQLLDLNGRSVHRQKLHAQSEQVRVDHLPAGTYILAIENDRGQMAGFRKIEIMR